MQDTNLSKYFYGDEAMQLSYFRIPRQLITHPRFKPLSADAKLLYGLLLDRMGLSIKNKWYDSDRRVYIYYTVDEVCVDLNCGRDKAMKLLAELDTSKGVGLIERVRQGQGKPARIYVLRFTTQELPPQPESGPELSVPCLEVEFDNVQKSDFSTSTSRDIRRAEVENIDPNYNNINQTDFIYTNQSINPPAPGAEQLGIDRYETREDVKERIEYERLQQEFPYDDVESLLELIVDVLSGTSSTIRIGGEVLPADAVRRRFRQLDGEHVRYVIGSLRQTTTKINNIRAYLLTALYNAPVTIGPYYAAAVRHDFR
jgi:hypothetical protein